MIDEAYLSSESFKSFQKAYTHEQQVRQQHTNNLKKFIHRHEKDFQPLSLPFTFEEGKLNNILAGKHVENPLLYGSYRAVGRMYIVGKVQFRSVTLFLFLHNNTLRTYNDYNLWGATLYKGAIQDLQPLASFRKNLTEHTKSLVRIVSRKHIVILVQRNVVYSTKFTIAQEMKSEYHFPISNKGRILNIVRF